MTDANFSAAAKKWCLNELVDSVRSLRSSAPSMLTYCQGMIKDANAGTAWLQFNNVSEIIDAPCVSPGR